MLSAPTSASSIETSRKAPRPGAPPAQEGGQDGGGGVVGGEDVGGLEVRGPRRGLIALLEVHEAGDGVDDVGECRPEPPRAGLAEARDGAVDDVGLDRAHRLVVAAEPADDAGHEVLDEDVGPAGEVEQDLAAPRAREIEAHALLARVHPREVRALVVAARLELMRAPAHLVALARTLHLDDAGAEVGEEARAIGTGEDAGEIEDDQAVERQRVVAHRRSIATGVGVWSGDMAIAPADLALLESIERRVLWLSTLMVHHANQVRPNPDGTKVGGHQASSSSVVSLLTALYFHALDPGDVVAVKAHGSPAFYAIEYLRGRLDREALEGLRTFGGLQAYPSRRKNPEVVDLSTGSMGLGAVMAAFSALATRYLADHGGVGAPAALRRHARRRGARRGQRVGGAARGRRSPSWAISCGSST